MNLKGDHVLNVFQNEIIIKYINFSTVNEKSRRYS
jgi:hypothetical protein